ncbi:uncharacterized protein LOC113497530 isoform X1 [Trichoplusia ni]|uniref:Uncharacterized protein LOC113497530 isoform X1 n=1 Tax=Trichoplusia ni TaxID=7111 RepID=A0A7E5VX50_TRINI|nr:uncharacterized protein LOC113497530 isoform X1 [Trichoplusia ni]
MLQNWLLLLMGVSLVYCYPHLFDTHKFKVGIEYANSLPMKGGSDRYRHRNNFDPFFVTVTATSKKGFVITYLEVTGIVDARGQLDFKVIRGQTGSTEMVFQLVSNYTDFLSFSYLTYGIKEEEYRKVANIITIPIPTNKAIRLNDSGISIFTIFLSLLCTFYKHVYA